jgi:hypothetical protein
VDVVRRGLTGQYASGEQVYTAAATLSERLECVRRLGGLFEQISFSPQMNALMAGQMVGAGCAV